MDLTLRKTYRTQLTKLVNNANDVVKMDKIDLNELPVLIARIKSLQTDLNSVNERLSPHFKEEELESGCLKIVEYSDSAVEAIARLENRHSREVKLLSTTSINANEVRDDEEQLFPISGAQRYGEYANTERIVDNYIQKLLSITQVKHERDISALRKLYNTASTVTRSLTTLGISPDQYGLLVKSILIKALPYNLRISFNKRKVMDDESDDSASVLSGNSGATSARGNVDYDKQISDLLTFIKVEIDSVDQARSVVDYSDSRDFDKDKNRQNNRSKNKNKITEFTVAGLLISANESCLFCKAKTHLTKDCDSSININDKKNLLKQNRRCFRCLKPNHSSKYCKSTVICSKCKRRHVSSMCDPDFKSAPKVNNVAEPSNSSTTLIANDRIDNVYLKTASVFILSDNNEKKMSVRVVIDGGSQLTFIKESLSRKLGLPIVDKHKIAIQSFGKGNRAPARLCNKVLIKIQSQYNDEIIDIFGIEIPEICFDSLKPPSLNDPIIRQFALKYQLANVPPKNYSVSGIALLIGADNYWKIVTGDMHRLSEELTAVNSKLGWTLLGSSHNEQTSEFMVNFNLATALHVQAESESDEIDINRFWSLETLGINSNKKANENFTLDFMTNNIAFNKGRYEVLLPWKDDTKLDSYYNGALVRVKSLTSKLLRNGKLCEYDTAIREYLVADCAEKAPDEVLNERAYYMLHRPVYRDDKDSTKIRVVFDASAHAPGLSSLNDKLFPGENLVPDLLRILLNFRVGPIGLIADIEKAFLQIGIAEQDRDSHRFLWYDKPINENLQSVIALPDLSIYRMKRVTFGVTTSPFILAATLRKHFLNQPEEFSGTKGHLLKSFYVGDFVVSVTTLDEAIRIFNESRIILRGANMNLRKWGSNDIEMNKLFEEEPMNHKNCKKVLGVLWYTFTDELAININSTINESCSNVPTKRNVLQTVATLFDPLGVLGPFTVRAKILLQNVWKKKLSWDVALPEDLSLEWFKWYSEISTLSSFQIPRVALHNVSNKVELHIFGDSSLKAYGAVAYLRCLENNECKFLMSKNRVAPINKNGSKQLTLPKLELTAALCAARLQSYILGNLDLNVVSIILWSDSKIALYWIRGSPAKREVYVQNRVTEIQKISQESWRYCPTTENPADLLTRGVSTTFLMESVLWLSGPDWLQKGSQYWPDDEYHDVLDNTVSTLLINPHEQIQNECIKEERIFPLEKYEKINKVFRITAYIQRFANNVKRVANKTSGPLTAQELNNAENYWIKSTQRTAFPDEIVNISKSKEISSKSSILTLNPFMDENGVLRLGGRLSESSLPYETRHPIILPKGNLFTKKIVINCHEQAMHSGVNATLAMTRRRYWIIQGRQHVKSICGKCLQCKRLKGKPGDEPFAPLPKNRLTIDNPFNITGVDFAGPLYVTSTDNIKTKVYVMLLTCAVVRAVHLELVPNLTTESCIRGLRRFISRRGVPAVMYSDNAKTLRRTAQELHELSIILNDKAVQDLAKRHRIEWHFIVERASWWGGFWERMVRTVKDSLKISLRRTSVGHDELQTILAEVEATVNSRPLTYIDDDPTNLLILSPSHILIGPTMSGLCMDLSESQIKRNEILKKWKIRESIVNKFWKRWSTDYLQQLRSAHHSEPVKSRTMKPGDVVLLYEQYLPRLHWKMVRITEVFQGRDGRVRVCEVQTSTGTKFRRPVQLLYPLEVDH